MAARSSVEHRSQTCAMFFVSLMIAESFAQASSTEAAKRSASDKSDFAERICRFAAVSSRINASSSETSRPSSAKRAIARASVRNFFSRSATTSFATLT